jgi:hypothetical protein
VTRTTAASPAAGWTGGTYVLAVGALISPAIGLVTTGPSLRAVCQGSQAVVRCGTFAGSRGIMVEGLAALASAADRQPCLTALRQRRQASVTK